MTRRWDHQDVQVPVCGNLAAAQLALQHQGNSPKSASLGPIIVEAGILGI